jgi:hypothetical protein
MTEPRAVAAQARITAISHNWGLFVTASSFPVNIGPSAARAAKNLQVEHQNNSKARNRQR